MRVSSFLGRNASCCDFKQLFPRLAGVAPHCGTGGSQALASTLAQVSDTKSLSYAHRSRSSSGPFLTHYNVVPYQILPYSQVGVHQGLMRSCLSKMLSLGSCPSLKINQNFSQSGSKCLKSGKCHIARRDSICLKLPMSNFASISLTDDEHAASDATYHRRKVNAPIRKRADRLLLAGATEKF